jgi:hypothetical protein
MKYLLKTELNGIVSYKIVDEEHELPKGTKYFIKYRPCIYKGVECAIIETSINNVVILFENKEIRVNHQAITTHHQH